MNNFDFNRYISFVDEISNDMNYPNSIRHLLYVVVPAFNTVAAIIGNAAFLEPDIFISPSSFFPP